MADNKIHETNILMLLLIERMFSLQFNYIRIFESTNEKTVIRTIATYQMTKVRDIIFHIKWYKTNFSFVLKGWCSFV